MIVVTGAAGFVGSVLTRALITKGEQVRALVTPNDDLTPLAGLNVEIVKGDVCDKDLLLEIFKGVRIVYHLAGMISITPDQLDLVEKVNVGGTKNVIEACMETGVDQLVYTSSVHAFVEQPHGEVMTEMTPIEPDKVVGHYAQSKAKATLHVQKSAEEGLNAIIVYPSGIIGPDDYAISHMGQLMIDYVKGRIPGIIEGAYDFVDVRDVVAGIIAASEKGQPGEGYILSGHQITFKELFYLLSHFTGKKPLKMLLPVWFLRIFIPLARFISKKLHKPPTLTSYALYTLSSNSLFSHEKATKELGYQPRPVSQTIRDTIEWYKRMGSL